MQTVVGQLQTVQTLEQTFWQYIYQNLRLTYPEIQPQRNKTNRRYIDIHIDTDTDIKGDTINWLTQSVICKKARRNKKAKGIIQSKSKGLDHGAADVNPGDQVPRTRSSKVQNVGDDGYPSSKEEKESILSSPSSSIWAPGEWMTPTLSES